MGSRPYGRIIGGGDESTFSSYSDVWPRPPDRIRDTAASHERVFFIEVMGRHAGFIALDVGLAGGAEVIAVPEEPVDPKAVAEVLEASQRRGKKSSIVVVAEGAYPGGAAGLLAAIREHLQVEARVTVLGHIQRGGSPTAKDRILASRLGAAAVEALVGGASGVMVGEVEGEVDLTPLKEAVERRKDINRALLRLSQVLAL